MFIAEPDETEGEATQMPKAASSLRPHIVQVMATRQGRILTTEEIYGLVADLGVAGFNPNAKRDRNLVNRELSDLAGYTTQGHGSNLSERSCVSVQGRLMLTSVGWTDENITGSEGNEHCQHS